MISIHQVEMTEKRYLPDADFLEGTDKVGEAGKRCRRRGQNHREKLHLMAKVMTDWPQGPDCSPCWGGTGLTISSDCITSQSSLNQSLLGVGRS